jgi:hypothetical protein
MPILGLEALHAARSRDAVILSHCAQDGICICTQDAFYEVTDSNPGGIWDTEIEGTPIRLALPGAIAGRTVQ